MTLKITAKEKEFILKRREVTSAKINKSLKPVFDALLKKLSKKIKLTKATMTYNSDEFPIVWVETEAVNVEKELETIEEIIGDMGDAEGELTGMLEIVAKKMKMYFDLELGEGALDR